MTELYHYGVKGMKWGIRNDKLYIPKSRHKWSVESKAKSLSRGDGPVPITRKPKRSKEYEAEVAFNSQKNNFSDVTVTDAQLKKERAVIEKQISDRETKRKGSSEYEAELEFNSRKNDFSSQNLDPTENKPQIGDKKKSDEFKKKLEENQRKVDARNAFKKQVSDGMKKVGDTLKEIGNKIASSVKAVVESGKNFVKNLFNAQKNSKKATLTKKDMIKVYENELKRNGETHAGDVNFGNKPKFSSKEMQAIAKDYERRKKR